MNNEPIAWMQMTPNKQRITKISFIKTWEDDVPLYTHPANLTDNETFKIMMRVYAEKLRQLQDENRDLKSSIAKYKETINELEYVLGFSTRMNDES